MLLAGTNPVAAAFSIGLLKCLGVVADSSDYIASHGRFAAL
jgi:hypothetical protein